MEEAFIGKIKRLLDGPLPGRKAQFVMAPSFRLAMPETAVSVKAGVLILLYPNEGQWSIVFMKRPDYEGVHGGQISFPGGKFDVMDGNLKQTALREAQEEIGIPPADIEVLGSLTPLFIPVSEYEVYPIVGWVKSKPEFKIDPYEVQYLIESRIDDLMDPVIRKEKPYSSSRHRGTVPFFQVQGHEIWGATAMMLNEFLTLLG